MLGFRKCNCGGWAFAILSEHLLDALKRSLGEDAKFAEKCDGCGAVIGLLTDRVWS